MDKTDKTDKTDKGISGGIRYTSRCEFPIISTSASTCGHAPWYSLWI